ncbi:hypothetical protein CFP56_021371 [Quercus suber]|uniref:Uncharacterized protein n=1 Tax=Quercus suber TaxID=58331 RepID=A0AAW0KDC5_QUESU
MPKGGIVQFRNHKRDVQIFCNCNHVTNLCSITKSRIKIQQALIVATFKKASCIVLIITSKTIYHILTLRRSVNVLRRPEDQKPGCHGLAQYSQVDCTGAQQQQRYGSNHTQVKLIKERPTYNPTLYLFNFDPSHTQPLQLYVLCRIKVVSYQILVIISRKLFLGATGIQSNARNSLAFKEIEKAPIRVKNLGIADVLELKYINLNSRLIKPQSRDFKLRLIKGASLYAAKKME